MFNKKNVQKSHQKNQNKEPTYWERVIYGKGTVAEPWATPEELWNDPKIQEIIQWNNDLIKKKYGSLS